MIQILRDVKLNFEVFMSKKDGLFFKIFGVLTLIIIVGLLFVIKTANHLLVKLNYVVD